MSNYSFCQIWSATTTTSFIPLNTVGFKANIAYGAVQSKWDTSLISSNAGDRAKISEQMNHKYY